LEKHLDDSLNKNDNPMISAVYLLYSWSLTLICRCKATSDLSL